MPKIPRPKNYAEYMALSPNDKAELKLQLGAVPGTSLVPWSLNTSHARTVTEHAEMTPHPESVSRYDPVTRTFRGSTSCYKRMSQRAHAKHRRLQGMRWRTRRDS